MYFDKSYFLCEEAQYIGQSMDGCTGVYGLLPPDYVPSHVTQSLQTLASIYGT